MTVTKEDCRRVGARSEPLGNQRGRGLPVDGVILFLLTPRYAIHLGNLVQRGRLVGANTLKPGGPPGATENAKPPRKAAAKKAAPSGTDVRCQNLSRGSGVGVPRQSGGSKPRFAVRRDRVFVEPVAPGRPADERLSPRTESRRVRSQARARQEHAAIHGG